MPDRLARHDLHCHTTWSDGGHSVAEQVMQADALELEVLAITDHLFPDTGNSVPETMERYLACVREESRRTELLVLAGAEATVLDCSGAVSVSPEVASRLDWVLCDLSSFSAGTLRDTPADGEELASNVLRSYHALCDLPRIDGIAHPFNTGRTVPALLPEDYPPRLLEELAEHMAETRTVFDVMNLMPWWFAPTGISGRELTAQYVELVRLFAARGVRFQVSSDDHRTGVGNTAWSHLVLERAGVGAEAVLSRGELASRASRSLRP